MSASDSMGLGFDTQEDQKISYEILNLRGKRGGGVQLNRYIVHQRPGLNSKPFHSTCVEKVYYILLQYARCAGSDGSMSASGSVSPGFDPWRFSFENFQPQG